MEKTIRNIIAVVIFLLLAFSSGFYLGNRNVKTRLIHDPDRRYSFFLQGDIKQNKLKMPVIDDRKQELEFLHSELRHFYEDDFNIRIKDNTVYGALHTRSFEADLGLKMTETEDWKVYALIGGCVVVGGGVLYGGYKFLH